MKRLKLTFSDRVYKELLDDIRRANHNLREFTHQNIALETVKQKRRSRRPITDLRLVRKHAASLYQVLMTDQTWKCTCKMHHLASLRLEARPRMLERGADLAQRHAFRILLSVANEVSDTTSAVQWHDIECFPSVDSQEPIPESQRDAHQTRVTGRVRFAPEPHTRLAALLDAEGNLTKSTTHMEMTYIESFCRILCAPDTERCPKELGLLVDKTNDEIKHMIYRADTITTLQSSSRSLENLLSAHKEPSDEGLSRKDRLQVAVILASSVLQLDGTAWLKSGWTTRLRTATRLHSWVYDEMGIPYGDVVRRCLFQLIDVRELSLDIEEVQQKVFDLVVTPLVDDLNNFNGVL
ncbi:MAG: hypothetical protein Q9196_007223, partial [Gyalolechia fulgens]